MRDTIEKWDWARFAAVEARLVCRAVPMWCAGGFDVSRGASRTAGRKTLRTGLRARLMSLAGQSRSACEQRLTLSVKIILPSVRVHLFFGVRSQLDCSLGIRGCWSWRPRPAKAVNTVQSTYVRVRPSRFQGKQPHLRGARSPVFLRDPVALRVQGPLAARLAGPGDLRLIHTTCLYGDMNHEFFT
jgi:hypothetical protein